MVPNMSVCGPQTESTSILIPALYGDVLTFTVEISTTANGRAQTIWTHQGSLNNALTVTPPKAGTYFWRVCTANKSQFTTGLGMAYVPTYKTWVRNASTLQNGTIVVM